MSPRDALTVRPTRFTDDVPGWRRILEAMGGVVVDEHPGRLLYQLGAGRVGLAAASPAKPAGTTELALETTVPLAEAVAAAAAEGVTIDLSDTERGPAGVVRAADGTVLTLEAATPGTQDLRPGEPRVAVMPVWRTPDARVALGVLDGLGLRRRDTHEDGSWADLTARGGGRHGVRPLADVGAELAFEVEASAEVLRAGLAAAGVRVEVHEEQLGRTLRLADPDGGEPVRVTERQPDLYSYALSEM